MRNSCTSFARLSFL
ncbi:hypothetical protein CP082626L3_0823A, partial [Chlamydia psittaci 08-2626_L3]